MAPTSSSAPSHAARSSAPWGLLRSPRERRNVLPLMGSGPARPDKPRLSSNNNNNSNGGCLFFISFSSLGSAESVLSNRGLRINAKKCLYERVIVATALEGAESRGMRSAERRKRV